jgi:phosphoglycerate dehydrogenase-like enzyme
LVAVAERFHVVITDFLDEASVEAPVLGVLADIALAKAHSEAELAGHLEPADALIIYHDVPALGEATFSRAVRCRAAVRAGVGYNNIDLKATGRRGILVCNVPDYGTEEVADHTIMLLLAVARRLLPCDASIRRGEWDYRPALPSPRLRGRTLGIVGCGRIGSATALRAKGFGLDVVFYDPYAVPGLDKALGVRRVDRLERLLEDSDIVSLHCFLDAKSHHLIDEEAFARMRENCILLNTARGPVVDQSALVRALDSGRLCGAGLDVFENEPLDDDRLRNHPKVVLTPHCAFYSVEGFVELRRKAAEEVRRVLLGQPPRCLVNRGELVHPRAPLG